ncbi:MAG: ABC transporter substrate-binding protein [gamma proteobacterium symbiont of Bathyaustriella thionipta]|nr:ABC transporter substrate-binding protein [gamma proteobacterium symbiont of Bathyaustriella thionipta]MCU7949371.1 ABC transporter substrate-binding protein [gamma proteobacterium symbiont of Bathyaustriella thionipta]MCU7952131.1 ABC transporter substrate-binding protein [gamma proteobacterium symbiont of Bathyaustriella thionipta]MCU7955944.1 ABC transporter substrate-binding protein [gamma proteobacterium symbiont of Bathyaustriella thionipta]MCU7967882.1 ABC transporter substrate-bindin
MLISLLSACSDQKNNNHLTDVRIGLAKQPSSALFHIAKEKGFFKEEGLNAKISFYPSGKRALVEGLLTDKSDYIACSDVPFVWKSFSHNNLMILASIYTADNLNRVIARNDSGIQSLNDLARKKVATQKQSAVHYFLHSILINNKISHNDIHFKFFKAELLPEKLHTREIDAFSMREPYISQAAARIGKDKVTVFAAPGLYIQTELLISKKEFLEKHSAVSDALLRALIKAEKYAKKQPEQAIDIVVRAIRGDSARVRALWHSYDLSVNLEHTLLLRLELLGHWLVGDKLINEQAIPDFSQRIYSQSLKTVKPEAIMIIQ